MSNNRIHESNDDVENRPLHSAKTAENERQGRTGRSIRNKVIFLLLIVLNIFLLVVIVMDRFSPSRKASTMTETSTTKLTRSSDAELWVKCATFEEDLDKLLQSTNLVMLGIPAESAKQSESMGAFAKECSESKGIEYHNERISQQWLGFSDQYELPSLVGKHFVKKNDLDYIIQGATDETLIIYVHRHETDRLLSAIEYVVDKRLCTGKLNKHSESFTIHNATDDRESYCAVDESILVDIIDKQSEEIGFNQLPCSFHDSIEENKPKMVAIDYKQVNKLQRTLAKHHCPEILSRLDEETPLINSATETEIPTYIKLSSDSSKEVLLSEWVEIKRNYLALVFDLNKKHQCRGEIKDIEEKMSTCNDEIVEFHVGEG